MKEFMVTKSSPAEIQNLAVTRKSQLVKLNFEQHLFLLKYVSNKNQ